MRTHLRRRRVKLKIDLRCAYASKFRETPSGCVYAAYLWYIALQLSNSETSWNLFWNFLKLSFCRSCRFHRGLGRWSCFEFEPSEDGEIKMNFWIDDPLRENQCLYYQNLANLTVLGNPWYLLILIILILLALGIMCMLISGYANTFPQNLENNDTRHSFDSSPPPPQNRFLTGTIFSSKCCLCILRVRKTPSANAWNSSREVSMC